MTVEELIEKLKKMPQDADVYHLWDGESRTRINVVYVAKAGYVITADFSQDCYSDNSRPIDAPTEDQQEVWTTPKDPNWHPFWGHLS